MEARVRSNQPALTAAGYHHSTPSQSTSGISTKKCWENNEALKATQNAKNIRALCNVREKHQFQDRPDQLTGVVMTARLQQTKKKGGRSFSNIAANSRKLAARRCLSTGSTPASYRNVPTFRQEEEKVELKNSTRGTPELLTSGATLDIWTIRTGSFGLDPEHHGFVLQLRSSTTEPSELLEAKVRKSANTRCVVVWTTNKQHERVMTGLRIFNSSLFVAHRLLKLSFSQQSASGMDQRISETGQGAKTTRF